MAQSPRPHSGRTLVVVLERHDRLDPLLAVLLLPSTVFLLVPLLHLPLGTRNENGFERLSSSVVFIHRRWSRQSSVVVVRRRIGHQSLSVVVRRHIGGQLSSGVLVGSR